MYVCMFNCRAWRVAQALETGMVSIISYDLSPFGGGIGREVRATMPYLYITRSPLFSITGWELRLKRISGNEIHLYETGK